MRQSELGEFQIYADSLIDNHVHLLIREITQKQLEEASGVRQPVIARMKKGTTDPQLMTILKILRPLGKTLAIVPIEEKPHRSVHFKTVKKGSAFKQKPMR